MARTTLREYLDKRNFNVTPEPDGTAGQLSERPVFVIQKHDASNLHYDFRLEVDGVLVSWAVPKGPSTDPREKRLAIRTEDHPLDYAQIEGMIPEGEYGAGTVLVWDGGPYRNLMAEKEKPRHMADSIRDGHVEVWLEGEKLTGGYALIHSKSGKSSEDNWLLIKMKDEAADARRNPVSTQQRSVLSGRTIEEIAAADKDASKDDGRQEE
jgi:DNA ligase D-like protein (predicted 3'-phosphoesterase)